MTCSVITVTLVAVCKSLQEGMLHATINLDTPDHECDLDYIPNEARKFQARAAMSTSLGFGGHNTCLVLKRFE